tara:strand:+ start:8512 stop:10623 length:2112 start_codon:yes stop_codon:yes gene_type:complete
MNDPVLKRKLFANRARHFKQIQTGNIPGHFLGGIGTAFNVLSRVGPAVQRGYRAFKAARAAPKPSSGFMTGGNQPNLATRIMGEQRGLKTSGLGGIESRAIKAGRIPRGAVTGAELALTAPIAAGSVNEIGSGVMRGDYGQVAGGLGGLLLSAPLMGRALRMAGMGKRTGKIGKVKEAMRDTGKGIKKLTPKGYGPMIAGGTLLGTGAVFAQPDTAGKNQVLGDPIDIQIKQYEKDNNVKLTDAQKQAVKDRLVAAQTDEKLTSADPSNLIPQIQKTQKVTAPSGDASAEEVEEEIVRTSNKEESGKKLSKQTLEFQKFSKELEDLTGTKDDTNNLILLKLASGLVTKKTGEKGVRGLLDVTGQAVGETVDTAIALKAKEKDRKNDLAVAYLKAKKDGTNQFQVTAATNRFLVQDPEAIGGQKVIDVKNFDSGPYKGYEAVKKDNGDGTFTWVLANNLDLEGAVNVGKAGDNASLRKLRTQLSGQNLGYGMAKFVNDLPENLIGPRGLFTSGAESVIGAADAIITGEAGSNPDAYIQTLVTSNAKEDEKTLIQENLRKDLEEAREYTLMDRKRFNILRPNDEELAKITKAKLIEVRLKYLLANANKQEDRLTQRDIDAAGELTKIFTLDSPRKIKGNYVAIMNDLNEKFAETLNSYQNAGGSNKFVEGLTNMPLVQDYTFKKDSKKAQDNINAILETINIGTK